MRIRVVLGVIVAFVAVVMARPALAQRPIMDEREPNSLAERVLILHQTVNDLGTPHPRMAGALSLLLGSAGAAFALIDDENGFGAYESLVLGGSATMLGGGIAAFLIDDPYRAEKVSFACLFAGEGVLIAGLSFLPYRDDGVPAGDGFSEGLAIAGAGIVVSSLMFAWQDHPAKPLAHLRRKLSTPSGRARMTAEDLATAEAELRHSRRSLFPRASALPLAAAALLNIGLALGEEDEHERGVDIAAAGLLGFVMLLSLPILDPWGRYKLRTKNAGIDISLTPAPSAIGVGLVGRF